MADVLSIHVPFNDAMSRHARVFSDESLQHAPYRGRAVEWVKVLSSVSLIDNWHAAMALLKLEDHLLPLALGQVGKGQTYIASPHHGYIDYARDELDQIDQSHVRWWINLALSIADPWFKHLRLDRAVSINAWGVSTYLYPQWTINRLSLLTEALVTHFPDRPLWMRTLNPISDGVLMSRLIAQGWQLWPSRQVYIFDPKHAADWANRRNNQIDQKLLRSTSLTLVEPDDFTQFDSQAMETLYTQLYVEKHSQWNAHYNAAYFAQAIGRKWLSFYGFRDSSDRLVAFIGVFEDDKTMTTPMLGYDTSLPQNLALYRLLMAKVLSLSLEKHKVLNLGAGSARFKKMRGGQPVIEWHAFYSCHLPFWQRNAMRLTGWLLGKSVPSFLIKQGL